MRAFVTAATIDPINCPKDFNNFPASLINIVRIGIVALIISKIPENKDLIASNILLFEFSFPLKMLLKKSVNIVIKPPNKSPSGFNIPFSEIFFVIPSNISERTFIIFCITTINPLAIFKTKLRIGVNILLNFLIVVSKKSTIFSIKPDSLINSNNAPIKLIIESIALAKVPDKEPANLAIEFKILKIIGKIADSILAAPCIALNNTVKADFKTFITVSKIPPCLIESLNDLINIFINSDILFKGFASEIIPNIFVMTSKTSSKKSGKDKSSIISCKMSCILTITFSIK